MRIRKELATKDKAKKARHEEENWGDKENSEADGGEKKAREDDDIPLIRRKKMKWMTLRDTLPLLPPPPPVHIQVSPFGGHSERVMVALLGYCPFDPYALNLNLPNFANLI